MIAEVFNVLVQLLMIIYMVVLAILMLYHFQKMMRSRNDGVRVFRDLYGSSVNVIFFPRHLTDAGKAARKKFLICFALIMIGGVLALLAFGE